MSSAQAIRLIVGLGNPGPDYADTRHNAGQWWIDRIARKAGGFLSPERGFFGDVARIKHSGHDVWLLFPTTYMNRSGQSVAALAKFYKIAPEHMLVAHDELDLAPGVIKLKKGGGHAGHNGLRDIAAQLGTPDFWRLRIGIGHPRTLQLNQNVADFVLHRPRLDEQIAIDNSLQKALDVLPALLSGQIPLATKTLHTSTDAAP